MLFNLNNRIKIKIVGAPSRFQEFLEEELNFLSFDDSKDHDDLDVIIKFEDGLQVTEHAVLHRAPIGYDNEGVFWFDPNHKIARIDFSNFDNGITALKVGSDFNTHFFYILILYLISFKSLRTGGVFCHASAVKYKGKTIIFPAWRHVGKTNLMLEFLKAGAELISDDGIIYYENGEIIAFSKRLHLLYFNFISNPDLLDGVDGHTSKLIDFVDKARGGHYELSDQSIEEVQKLIRVRLPNSVITKGEFKSDISKCDLIIHLNKNLSKENLPSQLKFIDLENLVVKTTESSLFELDHFVEAYKIASLTEGKVSEIMDNNSKKIRDITSKAFSNAEAYLELNFTNFLDSSDAKKLIDTYLDES